MHQGGPGLGLTLYTLPPPLSYILVIPLSITKAILITNNHGLPHLPTSSMLHTYARASCYLHMPMAGLRTTGQQSGVIELH